MFDELLESSANRKKTNTWTLVVSASAQIALIVVAILVPLIYTEALPKAMLGTILVAPPPPPPPPPPPAVTQVVRVKPVVRLMNQGVLRAPTVIPKQVNLIKEEELPPDVVVGVSGGVPGGVPGGQAGGVLGGIIGGVTGANVPPPPREAPKRVRVGGSVQQAALRVQVRPMYPPLAKQARIQGTVRLTAIIAKDGSIIELQIVSGHPLLQQAALQAVSQWKYNPTLLNGEPVEVVTTVDVVFTLSS